MIGNDRKLIDCSSKLLNIYRLISVDFVLTETANSYFYIHKPNFLNMISWYSCIVDQRFDIYL